MMDLSPIKTTASGSEIDNMLMARTILMLESRIYSSSTPPREELKERTSAGRRSG